jgi:hypothetical protein
MYTTLDDTFKSRLESRDLRTLSSHESQVVRHIDGWYHLVVQRSTFNPELYTRMVFVRILDRSEVVHRCMNKDAPSPVFTTPPKLR